ncbi:gluconolaconase [Ochrobactrum sp. P6BS-III]|uniref:SMP-30/gluconolactonase/LRE family protein n=1 Tax=unclassified Ochrobactrum TaxID=239106 RepID=UPI0009937B10|nr:sugar lactone lactonase YvrE [Ochrobactrum sp. P6BSIII]OOL15803.1 gluconolaconase [Ochrobactrum sp. P6BS-III]
MSIFSLKQSLIICLLLTGSVQAQDLSEIEFEPELGGGYPEGIAWNPLTNAFMVSSLRGGQVGSVTPDGHYRIFSNDNSLITTSGIVVDVDRNRLLICNEDVGISTRSLPGTRHRVAQVVELDLDTGAVQRMYDLSSLSSGATLANDLAVDAQGNIYVTDSLQPQIYKVDYLTKEVSVFVRSDLLMSAEKTEASGTKPYLNGIVYHPDGFLIASDYSRGLLWKIPLNNPQSFTEVQLSARLDGPDGLVLKSPKELVAVQSFTDNNGKMTGNVVLLDSPDSWATARIKAVASPTRLDGPTTATLRGDEVWVVNSRYPRLFSDPDNADNTKAFTILKVGFE